MISFEFFKSLVWLRAPLFSTSFSFGACVRVLTFMCICVVSLAIYHLPFVAKIISSFARTSLKTAHKHTIFQVKRKTWVSLTLEAKFFHILFLIETISFCIRCKSWHPCSHRYTKIDTVAKSNVPTILRSMAMHCGHWNHNNQLISKLICSLIRTVTFHC